MTGHPVPDVSFGKPYLAEAMNAQKIPASFALLADDARGDAVAHAAGTLCSVTSRGPDSWALLLRHGWI